METNRECDQDNDILHEMFHHSFTTEQSILVHYAHGLFNNYAIQLFIKKVKYYESISTCLKLI